MCRCKDTEHDFEQLQSSFTEFLFCRKCAMLVDVNEQRRLLKAEQKRLLDWAMRNAGPVAMRTDPPFDGVTTSTEGANA